MRELIAEHKPHIDKMNKTGPQLLELSPVEGEPIREKYTASDQLYTKLKADVKQRAATLDEAISKSTQVKENPQISVAAISSFFIIICFSGKSLLKFHHLPKIMHRRQNFQINKSCNVSKLF